jgi:hypothetical protein
MPPEQLTKISLAAAAQRLAKRDTGERDRFLERRYISINGLAPSGYLAGKRSRPRDSGN